MRSIDASSSRYRIFNVAYLHCMVDGVTWRRTNHSCTNMEFDDDDIREIEFGGLCVVRIGLNRQVACDICQFPFTCWIFVRLLRKAVRVLQSNVLFICNSMLAQQWETRHRWPINNTAINIYIHIHAKCIKMHAYLFYTDHWAFRRCRWYVLVLVRWGGSDSCGSRFPGYYAYLDESKVRTCDADSNMGNCSISRCKCMDMSPLSSSGNSFKIWNWKNSIG